MECVSYVVVTAVLGALSLQLSLRVIPSSVRVILGFPFLQHYDPRISWRDGTLTIVCGTGSWSVHTCPIIPVQPTAFSPVLSPGGTPTEIYKAPASKRAFQYVFHGEVSEGFLGHTSSSATCQVSDQTPRFWGDPSGNWTGTICGGPLRVGFTRRGTYGCLSGGKPVPTVFKLPAG